MFLGLGSVYVIVACIEAFKLSQINASTKKYVYFTDGFIAKRFIKIIAFICCGVVLYYSGSIIKYLSFLCFLIAITEVVVTAWRYYKNLLFVAFENDALIIATNKLNTMWANEVAKIETRHGLTYFVNQKNVSFTVRTDMMKENVEFKTALNNWITENKLESKVTVIN